MTGNELISFIGKTGEWRPGNGLGITVKVLDARKVFSRIDFLIEPIAGHNSAWVDADKVISLKGE